MRCQCRTKELSNVVAGLISHLGGLLVVAGECDFPARTSTSPGTIMVPGFCCSIRVARRRLSRLDAFRIRRVSATAHRVRKTPNASGQVSTRNFLVGRPLLAT